MNELILELSLKKYVHTFLQEPHFNHLYFKRQDLSKQNEMYHLQESHVDRHDLNFSHEFGSSSNLINLHLPTIVVEFWRFQFFHCPIVRDFLMHFETSLKKWDSPIREIQKNFNWFRVRVMSNLFRITIERIYFGQILLQCPSHINNKKIFLLVS